MKYARLTILFFIFSAFFISTPLVHGAGDTVTLTANGQTNITVNVGDTINYVWKAIDAISVESGYFADKADNCPGGLTSVGMTKPWIANNISGSASVKVLPCQADVTYMIWYKIPGVWYATTAIIVKVNPLSAANTNISITSLIQKARITPWNLLSADEQQTFTQYFGNGQHVNDISSTFNLDSAFAYSLGLGNNGITGVGSDGATYMNLNNQWTRQASDTVSIIQKARTTPWNMLSVAEQQTFNQYFGNGQHISDIPTSFNLDSAFAYSLGLGNQGYTSVGSDGATYTNQNNQWMRSTQLASQTYQPLQIPTSQMPQVEPTYMKIDPNNSYTANLIVTLNNLILKYKNLKTSVMFTPSVTDLPVTPVGGTPLCSQSLVSDIRKGDSGENVSQLTKILVDEGLLGQVQNNFDDTVYQAVISYQEKYADSILTPVGVSRGTGFVGPSTRGFINRRIVCNQGASTSVENQTSGTDPMTFRYLKLDTTKGGWVSWREIEAYDANGTLVKPVASTASCVMCGYTTGQANALANLAYDGNSSTSWNAGETLSWCGPTQPNMACNTATRHDWIQLDYGKNVTFSKIRALPNGNSGDEVTKVLTSKDGSKFTELTKIVAPTIDNQWIEYPFKVYGEAPSVDLFVSNTSSDQANLKEVKIFRDQTVYYKWTAKNADYLDYTETKVADTSLGSRQGFICEDYIWGYVNPFRNITSSNANANKFNPIPFSGTGSLRAYICNTGLSYTVTLTAHQRGSNVTNSSSVKVNISQ
jgi:hypothetical protein